MHSPRPRSPIAGPSIESSYFNTPSRGRQSGLKSRGTQLLALRFGWVVLVVWFEFGDFFHSLSTCKFPDSVLRRSASRSAGQLPTHVVLLADPHVPHPFLSYPSDARPWINLLRQAMDELFMRKSWNVVMRLGRVDAVIVVGDMLDWGRGVMSDQEYEDYLNIFYSVFRLPRSVPMHFVPGNHDLPLGPNRLFSPHARDRYARHFSPPNAILPIANHSLILLDAVGLVEEDYRRYAAEMQFGEWDGTGGGVIEFVKALGEDPPPGPKILISHIPLARPEASTCGPLRERGRILKGAGPGYQNLLGSETSKFLLEVIKPTLVFSGDDHDYCEHTHSNGVREVTIKSFSSCTGIRRPGFQLLSLIPPSSSLPSYSQITHADRPCFLPDQVGVYNRVYLPLAIVTVLYLLFTNIRSAWQRWTATGHSVYGDLKSRLSPGLPSAEFVPNSTTTARRVSDRSVPLTLPSRNSSQHLVGLGHHTANGSPVLRPNRLGSAFGVPETRFARSAPVSPQNSPRLSYSEEAASYSYNQSGLSRTDDEESVLETPSLSRRSSYIYMHGGPDLQTPAVLSHEAPSPSYFLPMPSNANTGLGLSTPTPNFLQSGGQDMRRASSSNLSAIASSQSSAPARPGFQNRRVTMPRMVSTADWSAAAKAKETSIFGLMVDTLAVPGLSRGRDRDWTGLQAAKGFARWLWKGRNGVVMKSWREVMAVAWPPGVVWVMVNALFFLG